MSTTLSPHKLEDMVVERIKMVFDPEIPVNIYDLGLIYDISITAQNEAVILMTLTSPACPEAGELPGNVERSVKEIEEITDAKVILTFSPPWDKSMMSDAAALELGLF